MKKVLLSFAVVALAGTAYVGVNAVSTRNSSLLMQNVEAVADAENGGGHLVCHSNSRVVVGETYIDCSTCCKVYDERGKGSVTKCAPGC